MIIVRGDSHFSSKGFMQWCGHEYKIGFITGLSGNKKLKELAAVTIKRTERGSKQYGKPVKWDHTFVNQAGSWSMLQKVVVKVEATHIGTNVRYIVTNLVDFRAKDLYEKGYCARCGMELHIKEHKLYLRSDKSSCHSFLANQFRLFLHSMAYVLMHKCRRNCLMELSLQKQPLKTFRTR